MNCKQGDLAILIRGHDGNEGKIFKLLELTYWGGQQPRWVTDPPMLCGCGRCGKIVPPLDSSLRPLRGDEEPAKAVKREVAPQQ